MSSTKNNETIVDILREYRADAVEMDAGRLYQPTTEYLRRLLNRIEAAATREPVTDSHAFGNAAAIQLDKRLLAQPSINVNELRERIEDISGSMREFAADIKECHDGIAPDVASHLSAGIREYATWLEFATERYLSEGSPLEHVGNAAAMREALVNIAEYAKSALCHTEDSHVLGYLAQIENHANAALSAPARNCDRFKTAEEAMEYHKRTNCAKRRYCAYRDGCPTDGSCLVNYLFATATISKGDTDGSK